MRTLALRGLLVILLHQQILAFALDELDKMDRCKESWDNMEISMTNALNPECRLKLIYGTDDNINSFRYTVPLLDAKVALYTKDGKIDLNPVIYCRRRWLWHWHRHWNREEIQLQEDVFPGSWNKSEIYVLDSVWHGHQSFPFFYKPRRGTYSDRACFLTMDVDPPTWNNDEANNPVRKLTPLKKLKIKVEQDGKSECLDLKIFCFPDGDPEIFVENERSKPVISVRKSINNHGRDDFKIALGYKKATFFLVAYPEALLETWELQVEIDSATKNIIYHIPSLKMGNSTFVINLENAVSDTVVKVDYTCQHNNCKSVLIMSLE